MAKSLAQLQRDLKKAERELAKHPYTRPSPARRAEVEDAMYEDAASLRQVTEVGARFFREDLDNLLGFAAAWASAPQLPPYGIRTRFYDVFKAHPDQALSDKVVEAISDVWEYNIDEVVWSADREHFYRDQMHFASGYVDHLHRCRRFTFALLHLMDGREGMGARKAIWVRDGSGWKIDPKLKNQTAKWIPKLDDADEGLRDVRAWDYQYVRLRD